MTATDAQPEPSPTEATYRARSDGPWDRVAKVTHCVDYFPGGCSLNAFVRDGVVVREESSGDLPPMPDVNGSINDFWAGFHQVWGRFYPTFSTDDVFHSDTVLI